MRKLIRRLQYLVHQRRIDAELAEEVESHRRMREQALEARGVSADDVRFASRRALGNTTLAREDARAVWLAPWLESVWQDASYALRTLGRQPLFALVAAGALAAAIGLNTSIFTLYNALVLRSWPVANPDEVVTVLNTSPQDLRGRAAGGPNGFSLAEVRYFSEHSQTFSGFVVTRVGGGDKRIGEARTPASWVSGTYFTVLGVAMTLGRGFTAADDRPEAPAAVAVLSYGYWQREFGADPGIVGKTIGLEGVPFTVTGVTARRFTGTVPEPVDIWMPLASSPLLRPDDRWVRNVLLKPENCCSALAGRLRPGVTRAAAQSELAVLSKQFRRRAGDDGGIRVAGTQFSDSTKGDTTGTFGPMLAGSMLVLFIACANVANLLLARASARRREIGVRLSIGAGRGRIVRQLLTESFVLAGIAAALGLLIALWLPAQLVKWTGADPAALQLSADGRVLFFTLAVTALATMAFGLMPALHGARAGAAAAVKDAPLRPSGWLPLRGILLSTQVAIAVVLLASAAVLVHAIRQIAARDLGFESRGVAVASLATPLRGYDAARVRAVALEVAEALRAQAAGQATLASTSPLGSGNIKGSFRLTDAAGDDDQFNTVYEVSPEYFDFLRIPIVAGRALTATDSGRPAIVINESMAKRYWKSADAAVGRFIVSGPPAGGYNLPGTLEIVGVARDVFTSSLSDIDNTIYQPLSARGIPQVLLRDTAAARSAITRIVAAIDPALRSRIAPLSANIEPRLRGSRAAALLAGAMGALALGLASVGMFAVFAYWVQQRTHEIGIRMALGAGRRQVEAMVLRSSALAIGPGVIVGIVGAIAASRVLRSYVFGLDPIDPAAYAAVTLVIAAAGAAATFWPARRAARVDPVVALRQL